MMPERRAEISVNAFAKRLGVDEKAVRKAIASGRIERGVGRGADGAPVITDPELATAEFHQNRDVAKVRGPAAGGISTADARRELIREQTRKLKIANDLRLRELLPAGEAQRAWGGLVVAAKTKLLGLPSLAKQRLPHLTLDDLAVLDQLVREALEQLAEPEEARA